MALRIVATAGDGRYIMQTGPDLFAVHLLKDYVFYPVSKEAPIGSLTKMGYWTEVSEKDSEKFIFDLTNIRIKELNKRRFWDLR